MNVKSAIWSIRAAAIWALLSLAAPALAQGFAGLGQSAEGFALPDPAERLQFPADHGPHPGFRIEWWYLTANLTDVEGRDYGVQWTLFRSALTPGDEAEGPEDNAVNWSSPQVWLGHAGLTTATQHFSAERLARGGIGHAGVRAAPFAAWIDAWEMSATGDSDSDTGTGTESDTDDALDRLTVRASGPDFGYVLDLTATGPLVAQGKAGYSVKSASGQASHYYSQPFYTASGTLRLPGAEVAVTGQAWLDREWSSQPLAEGQTGWDWFSLHLDGGGKVMAFRLRDKGLTGGFTSGTWISADGVPTPLPDGALQLDPLEHARVAGRDVPVRWRLTIPQVGLDIRTRPLNPQSWMNTGFAYWEGPIRFDGSHSGRGYLEMTGYE